MGAPTAPFATAAGAAASAAPGENATTQAATSTATVTALVLQLGRSWSPACMDDLLCGERANPGSQVRPFATLVVSAGGRDGYGVVARPEATSSTRARHTRRTAWALAKLHHERQVTGAKG